MNLIELNKWNWCCGFGLLGGFGLGQEKDLFANIKERMLEAKEHGLGVYYGQKINSIPKPDYFMPDPSQSMGCLLASTDDSQQAVADLLTKIGFEPLFQFRNPAHNSQKLITLWAFDLTK